MEELLCNATRSPEDKTQAMWKIVSHVIYKTPVRGLNRNRDLLFSDRTVENIAWELVARILPPPLLAEVTERYISRFVVHYS